MLTILNRHRFSLSLTAAAAAWGIAAVISKRAVAEIAPLTLLPIQLAVSVAVLAMAMTIRRVGLSCSPQLRRIGVMGVLNPGVSYALSLVGLTYITASLSVLLWATEPLLILMLAWWLLGDRITKPLVMSVAVALAGVVLVVFESDSEGHLVGVALTLAGVVACAFYTVISRKLIFSDSASEDSTLAVVAVQQAFALVFSIVLVAVLGRGGVALADVSAAAWISAVLSGLLYYAVAFWLYLTGLRRVSAGVAGMFINLIPVFGIAAGHLLLDERLSGRQWIGAVLIVAAVSAFVHHQTRPHT